ncbi:PucR family transcriptional regulator [Streptomyces agglomeratus]|uniref:PucR family transcriptional regulator n=1 Tax=Streptomyces agglomeratus TaxID=285458 RepID=A0A1E5P3Y1_9ACTN|nr:helix-turn-helix domain-containing protein [Streptomyces agglomeratus]OEJ24251.1 PucR family transcriptional regulator [Streptomyces agglomeratus]OEJ41741.1 PucR family transcriptional regulator [Streptomyces agglomeratus]OEJ43882.1 PucR family transcriptional regulator [Streptomyces agglomeratus]OEJ54234.1 PucR family transcriptional regulator [Streptomyces agglomeratus]OEJ61603.1 PucR family transcriptional regulator [Streptomyces agglomeratus]
MSGRRARTGHDWAVLTEACTALLDRLPELVDQHLRELHAHSPLYARVLSQDQHWQETEKAMRIGIEAISAPRTQPRRDLEYAEWTGRRRAQQGFPLELLVHSYRQAGYLIWDALLESAEGPEGGDPEKLAVLMRAATTVFAAVDAETATASESYRATEAELRHRTDERLQALLDALLEGKESAGLAARAAAGLDLPEQGRYAVVVLRLERRDGREPFHRRIQGAGMRFIWRMRTDCEVGVVSLGEETTLADLSELLAARCPGPGGISPVVEGLAGLGRARRLADLALRTCAPDATGIVRLDERMPTALVVSQPELAERLVADVFGNLMGLDPADRVVLLETLDAWLACEGSAGRTAGRLYCHRNTVFNRLRRLEQLTSRSLSRPRDLIEMTLALDAFRLSGAA